MAVTLEQLLDRIADRLIISDIVNPSIVNKNQKTIRNGQLQIGRTNTDKLILYQSDVKANQQDLLSTITITNEQNEEVLISKLQEIANRVVDINNVRISLNQLSDSSYIISLNEHGNPALPEEDITDIIFTQIVPEDGENIIINPLNVSQFVPLQQSSSIVDIDKAEEFLDTNIFELLPTGDTRQARITRFFQELNALLPPDTPEFDLDNDNRVDRGLDNNWTGSLEYSQDNSISYAQDNQDSNIDEEDAFIHRLKDTANDTNSSKTIEDIYNTILPYLTDILEEPILAEDDRPEYRNQSSGYLQFRNPNQGIIVRNTNQEFIEGLDPNNPTWLTETNGDVGTGFTITMWVRFLDKVSEGTLFNFGNPTREVNPFGFRLETFVISPDTLTGNPNNPTFETLSGWSSTISADNPNGQMFVDTNTERFVRLIVRDPNTSKENYTGNFGNEPLPGIYDSHTASPHNAKQPYLMNPSNPYTNGSPLLSMLTTTKIPTDFNEWYFICASFNPNVTEPAGSGNVNNLSGDTYYVSNATNNQFWLNHTNANGTVTPFSGLGNKCKVEIISRTDLLRARGFKV